MIRERGYQGSVRQLRRALASLRPVRAEPFLRLYTFPAEQAQADWASFGEVAVGRAAGACRALSSPCPTHGRCIWSSFLIRPWKTSCAVTSTPFKPGRANPA